jgi:hypothetical protein
LGRDRSPTKREARLGRIYSRKNISAVGAGRKVNGNKDKRRSYARRIKERTA